MDERTISVDAEQGCGRASQSGVADVGGIGAEADRFPLSSLPHAGITGVVETDGDAARTAEDIDAVADDTDHGSGR
ncbi:hypothetical protein [Rathayibacter sp. VKM Ac-2801]|uniref:hypothetical protein n=1 Tax=Rathayibacter sp. VKM Ac-2801 TaxID=2609255 RepID=UPI00131FFA0F|nr:hypothetical protein [Rathayibacter sp. VKM Ac-2801]QHC69732.1 hypothetical protein GSU45_04620 [Rathayibacter sp. VKM Ac-2801]